MRSKNLISALSISSFLLAVCLNVSCSQEQQQTKMEKKPEKLISKKLDLGTHIVDSWEIKVEKHSRYSDIIPSHKLDITINPPEDIDDKASVLRMWMGDKNSNATKTEISGHGHGDYEMHYDTDIKFEEGDDKAQFSLEVETEKNKKIIITIQEKSEGVISKRIDLGIHTVDSWKIEASRYQRIAGTKKDQLIMIVHPPEGVEDKASTVKLWMGDKNSNAAKIEMPGDGYDDLTMYYDTDIKFEEGDDKTQFSLGIKTEKGKILFKTIQF